MAGVWRHKAGLQYIGKLHRELEVLSGLNGKFLGLSYGDPHLNISLTEALIQDESDALDSFLDSFVDADDYDSITPKILEMAHEEAKQKHFHNINYNTELDSGLKLYAKRTMVQGEVTQVDWYRDEALTDKVLCVEIVYTRDVLGFAISRQTTRTWINRDDSPNPDTKITHKRYDINLNEQLEEGQRRRTNLANNLSLQVLGQMQVVLYGQYTPDVIVQKGRDFLLKHSVAWNEFIKASHQQILTDIAAPDAVNDEWLDGEMVPGVTIRQYMISEMTLY